VKTTNRAVEWIVETTAMLRIISSITRRHWKLGAIVLCGVLAVGADSLALADRGGGNNGGGGKGGQPAQAPRGNAGGGGQRPAARSAPAPRSAPRQAAPRQSAPRPSSAKPAPEPGSQAAPPRPFPHVNQPR